MFTGTITDPSQSNLGSVSLPAGKYLVWENTRGVANDTSNPTSGYIGAVSKYVSDINKLELNAQTTITVNAPTWRTSWANYQVLFLKIE